MVRPARFGITAAVGNPDHPFSWVALEDLVDALIFIMGKEDISGPVNVTAPERTTNREFYKAAAEHFHTRLSIHVPDAVLRLLMGGSLPGDYQRAVRHSGDADAGGI